MCCTERIRNLNRQFQRLVERKRLAGNTVLQCFAVEELHRNEVLAVLLADVMDGTDVGMIQCGRGLCFAAETFERSSVVEHFGRQEFQSDCPM
jgi:hypothetical protein